MSSTADVAQVVSGLGAAGAAIAAWLTVRQDAALQRSQAWPHLVAMPEFDGRTRRMNLEIHNAGKGLARQVFYAAVLDREIVKGPVGTTFIRPGESVPVRTAMACEGPRPEEPPYAALWCMDIHNNTHVFSLPEGATMRWDSGGGRLLGRGREGTEAPDAPNEDAQPALATCCAGHEGRRAKDLERRGYVCKVDGGLRVYDETDEPLKRELFPEEYEEDNG